MKKYLTKLLIAISIVSFLMPGTGITISAKKKPVVPKPKIVSVKHKTYDNMVPGKQVFKVSWNNVKAFARIHILNSKKKVVAKTIWQKQIKKKGTANVIWYGGGENFYNLPDGTYYVKFILGKKNVSRMFKIKSTPGIMKYGYLNMKCPPGYSLIFNCAPSMPLYRADNQKLYYSGQRMSTRSDIDTIVEDINYALIQKYRGLPDQAEVTEITLHGIPVKQIDVQFRDQICQAYCFMYRGFLYMMLFEYNTADTDESVADIQYFLDSMVLL